jgi:hypothetical protein
VLAAADPPTPPVLVMLLPEPALQPSHIGPTIAAMSREERTATLGNSCRFVLEQSEDNMPTSRLKN